MHWNKESNEGIIRLGVRSVDFWKLEVMMKTVLRAIIVTEL